MKITVFVRPVHNPGRSIEPASTSRVEELPGYQPIPNPLDELALETALILKDRFPERVNISACSVGGEASQRVLHEFIACGAEEALWMEENCWEPDGLVVANRLSEFYRREPFDLGLFGANDLDTGAGQVGPMFSALTGLPYIDSVVDIEWPDGIQLEVIRRQKRLYERIHVSLPVCLGIQRGAILRYPSFWGKINAEQSSLRKISFNRSSPHPKVERNKFTRAKPKKGAAAGIAAQTRSVDMIRQAVGFLGKKDNQAGDSLIRGKPKMAAMKIVDIWKKEKVIELNDPVQISGGN